MWRAVTSTVAARGRAILHNTQLSTTLSGGLVDRYESARDDAPVWLYCMSKFEMPNVIRSKTDRSPKYNNVIWPIKHLYSREVYVGTQQYCCRI